MSSRSESGWSRWEWTEQYQCEHRYRKNKKGDWEYDYRQVVTEDYARQTPRGREADPPPLETIEEVPQQNYNAENFNYNPVDGLSQSFAQTSISTHEMQPSNHAASSSKPFTRGYNQPPRIPNNNPKKIYAEDPRTKADLDPSYKFYKSKEFYFGRIFKVLWSEPFGSGGTELTERVPAKYGENAYHSIRRFLIVAPKKGHCICLPILTYGGQGTLKYGVHPEDHAMIHTYKKGTPDLLPLEKLTRRAIRVIPSSDRHHLDEASRLNYNKVYTVEHNVKVAFVGHVEKKYEQTVVTVYNSLHTLKNRGPEDDGGNQDELRNTEGEDPQYPTMSNAQSWIPPTSQETTSPYGSPATYPPSNMYPVSSEAYHSSGTYSSGTAWETQTGYNTSAYPSTEKETTPPASYPAMTEATENLNASSAEHAYAQAPNTTYQATDPGGTSQTTSYNVPDPADQTGGSYTESAETPYVPHTAHSTTPGVSQQLEESTGYSPEAVNQNPQGGDSARPSSRESHGHVRSCNRCRTKRIKCDKIKDCTNCRRSRAVCTYESEYRTHSGRS